MDWPYFHHHPRSIIEAESYDLEARIPYDDVDSLSVPLDPDIRPEDSYSLYATAMKGIVNWPDGFHEFLKIYRLREVKEIRSQLDADFGALYSDWVKKKWEPFPFIQDAFHQYLVDQYAHYPSVAQPGPQSNSQKTNEFLSYTTTDEAARLLGISPKTVDRLARAQLLYQFVFPSRWPDERYKFFRRAEVFELQHRWQDGIPLADAAKYLGLSEQITMDLSRRGLLFAKRNPDVGGHLDWAFSPQAVTECYYEVEKSVMYWGVASAMADLTQAAQILAVVGLDIVGILQQMAERNLTGNLPERSSGLGEMMFHEPSLRSYLEKFKVERGWLDSKEAAKQMKVAESVLLRWVNSGLLVPLVVCGSANFFDPVAVKEFITGHVFTDEATKIAGVSKNMLQTWMHEGLLKPVSGPKVDMYYRNLFRREDLEQMRSGHLPNSDRI